MGRSSFVLDFQEQVCAPCLSRREKSNVAAVVLKSRVRTSKSSFAIYSETRDLPRPVRVDTVHSSMVYQDLCFAEYLGLHDNHAFTPRCGRQDK
jgi:hypothetical protein